MSAREVWVVEVKGAKGPWVTWVAGLDSSVTSKAIGVMASWQKRLVRYIPAPKPSKKGKR